MQIRIILLLLFVVVIGEVWLVIAGHLSLCGEINLIRVRLARSTTLSTIARARILRSLATSASAARGLGVFLRRARASAGAGGALVAAAAGAVDFVLGGGFFAVAGEGGLFAAGAGGFF